MNPNTTIRPWLIACNNQGRFGAKAFEEIEAPDPSTHAEIIYFTYFVKSAIPNHRGQIKRKTQVGETHDVRVQGLREWSTKVEIEIVNSPNGLSELAACVEAAEGDEDIYYMLKQHGVTFRGLDGAIENKSTRTASRMNYRHRMTCIFHTIEMFNHLKTNHKVDEVDVSDAIDMES